MVKLSEKEIRNNVWYGFITFTMVKNTSSTRLLHIAYVECDKLMCVFNLHFETTFYVANLH